MCDRSVYLKSIDKAARALCSDIIIIWIAYVSVCCPCVAAKCRPKAANAVSSEVGSRQLKLALSTAVFVCTRSNNPLSTAWDNPEPFYDFTYVQISHNFSQTVIYVSPCSCSQDFTLTPFVPTIDHSNYLFINCAVALLKLFIIEISS